MQKTDAKSALHLLIVDDEPDLRDVLSLSLRLYGYNVTTAESGKRALALLAAETFDLIISDIRMPNGDGLELLDQVGALDYKTPLIFMTGYADLTTDEARARGAHWLISKPFTIEEMINVIERISAQEKSKTQESPSPVRP